MKIVSLSLTALLIFAIVTFAGNKKAFGQTETVLYSFTGGADGGQPRSDLTLDNSGNLYGTTSKGGNDGSGIVFKLDTTRNLSVIHTFTNGADGGSPYAGLFRDESGNLFGTTSAGGNGLRGTVFKINNSGKQTTLYPFDGGQNGGQPVDDLIQDARGNLYGTTVTGGDLSCASLGCGVLFKLDKSGILTALHTFLGGQDGSNPDASVTFDTEGNLFGTVLYGGNLQCDVFGHGCGVLFKLDKAGKYTVVHAFSGGTDGSYPLAALVWDPAGNGYSTTNGGGAANAGTIFKLDTSGQLTVLYAFRGGRDGRSPGYGHLLRDAKGNFYGTTQNGGTLDNGVVFKLSSTGKETVLYRFRGGVDGANPQSGLMMDSTGNLYGATLNGGAYNQGTLFKIKLH